MKVLAIDPGTAIVGYGIVEYTGGNYKVIDYGCIYTDKEMAMPARLAKIYENIEMLITLHKPESAAVEELFFFKNSKTVITVGQARGVILLCCERNGVPSYGYTPLQVKQGIASYGRADKHQIQEMVKRLLGLNEIPKPDDAADALALAITHINTSKSVGMVKDVEKNTDSLEKPVKSKGNKISAEEFRMIIQKKK